MRKMATTDPSGEKETAHALITSARSGQYVTLRKVQPFGSLTFRKDASGAVNLFWRYTYQGRAKREPIGIYDSMAPPKAYEPTARGFGIAAAMRHAEKLSFEHQQTLSSGGRPAVLARQKKEAKTEAEEETVYPSLQSLMDVYVRWMTSEGRVSANEVESTFRVHVINRFPEIAQMPARDVKPEHVVKLMRGAKDALVTKGKIGRTANRLRGYLCAAYERAKEVSKDASSSAEFAKFGISVNTPKLCKPIASVNRRDKASMPMNDIRKLWRHVRDMKDYKGRAMQFFVLLGGQRMRQLVRLRTSQIHPEGYIVIYELKGRGGIGEREHSLPLRPRAARALKALKPVVGSYALTTDGGKTHLNASTLSLWLVNAAKDAGILNFQVKRLRKSAEVILAADGVPKEHREHLHSHGLSGVTLAHYNDSEWLEEKDRALAIWEEELEAKDDKNDMRYDVNDVIYDTNDHRGPLEIVSFKSRKGKRGSAPWPPAP